MTIEKITSLSEFSYNRVDKYLT